VDAIDLPDATLQAAMEELLAPLMAELQQGMEPGELLARLGELYPAMPGRNLEELLARALFVSEVWGRVSAAGE
jgi:phage gp29-like protein